MSTADQVKWNKKYRQRLEKKERPLLQPNERLTRFNHYFRGNRALDLACGLGANSLYLARLGYDVTAVDISDVAIQHLNQLALDGGLAISANVVDLKTYSLPLNEYDLVVNTLYLQRDLFAPMQACLTPGGYLFFETFYAVAEDDPNPGMSEAFKLRSQELLQVFHAFRIIYYHEDKETGLATLFAQKK